MYCFNCGAQLPDSAKFCVGCGNPTAVASTPTASPVPAKKLSGGARAWIIICIVANAAVGVSLVALSSATGDSSAYIVLPGLFSFAVVAGYSILLSGKKVGFYVVCCCAFVVMIVNFVSGNIPQGVFCVVNPVITWFVVRSLWDKTDRTVNTALPNNIPYPQENITPAPSTPIPQPVPQVPITPVPPVNQAPQIAMPDSSADKINAESVQKAYPSMNGKFYVFVADTGNGQRSSLGMSIGMMYGNLYGSGDMNFEVNKLKNQYQTENELELIIVNHSEWSPKLDVKSIGGGMSSVNFDKKANSQRIEKYLKQKGYAKNQIDIALKICEDKNLQSSDSTVGRFFIGVPIT